MPRILYSQVIKEGSLELKVLEKYHCYSHLFQRVRVAMGSSWSDMALLPVGPSAATTIRGMLCCYELCHGVAAKLRCMGSRAKNSHGRDYLGIFELSIRYRSVSGNLTDKPDPAYPRRQVEVATDELLREAIWDYFWDLEFRWDLPVSDKAALLVTDYRRGGVPLEDPPIDHASEPPIGYS